MVKEKIRKNKSDTKSENSIERRFCGLRKMSKIIQYYQIEFEFTFISALLSTNLSLSVTTDGKTKQTKKKTKSESFHKETEKKCYFQ